MKTLQNYIKEGLNDLKPKTKKELFDLVKLLIKQRGNDADLNDIDTSLITNFDYLFEDFPKVNVKISKWDVSNVTNMQFMFAGCEIGENVDLSEWNVSKVKNMRFMFNGCVFKNKNFDISKWDVSNVTDMEGMFWTSTDFNGDISEWDVSNVENMSRMFKNSDFNGDISKWDVSNVEDMYEMFALTDFNNDISNWNIKNVKDARNMFDNPIRQKFWPKDLK